MAAMGGSQQTMCALFLCATHLNHRSPFYASDDLVVAAGIEVLRSLWPRVSVAVIHLEELACQEND
jgi:hypothetical protein